MASISRQDRQVEERSGFSHGSAMPTEGFRERNEMAEGT